MAGLIPLLLKPAAGMSNRTIVAFQPSSHSRQASTGSIPNSRPKAMRRLSQPAPTSLPALPYTVAEWRRAILEIKRLHLNRKYRACSTRCSEILESLRNASAAEPAYLLYIHFYAAASLEMCARALTSPSPYRTDLLHRSRTHYDRAAALIKAAEDSISTKTRSSSAASSRGSSQHSPSGSVSSRAWTSETGVSSPTQSACSLEDAEPREQKPVKKKVSFSLPPEAHVETFALPEPIIRPDSPTLGFDDEYFRMAAAREELPELPKPKPVEIERTVEAENISLPEAGDPEPESRHDHDSHPPSAASTLDALDSGDFFLARSVHRYCAHLSVLRSQLAAHAAVLDSMLVSVTSPAEPLLVSAKRARESSASASDDDDLRAMDRQARIERLRKAGWRRKRFDARRYEDLCDAAMAELA